MSETTEQVPNLKPLPEFIASLPAVYVGAGALFTDREDRVLLVKPTYKEGWEIPGGAMDAGEYPSETVRREVEEELALVVEPGRALAVDFALPRPQRPRASIMYVFDCGVLDEEAIGRIRLQESELSEFRFVPVARLADYVIPRMERRLAAAHARRGLGGPVDLENGYVPGVARGLPG